MEKLKKRLTRVEWRIRRCLRRFQFYYKVIRQPILVEHPPIAVTLGMTHELRRIEFTPTGATLHFSGVPVREPLYAGSSTLYLAGATFSQSWTPLYMEFGDTLTIHWRLKMEKLEDGKEEAPEGHA